MWRGITNENRMYTFVSDVRTPVRLPGCRVAASRHRPHDAGGACKGLQLQRESATLVVAKLS